MVKSENNLNQENNGQNFNFNVVDHFFKLTNAMDNIGLYKYVDYMIKTALDLNHIMTDDSISGVGGYGKFYSKFSPEEMKKMKNQLGQIPDDIGIKKLYDKNNSLAGISENLAFVYIAPYIKANTDLTIPVNKGIIPLSGMISNKITATQKMPGTPIDILLRSFGINKYDQNSIGLDTEKKIRDKLDAIGVSWTDIHTNNYFIHPETAAKFHHYFTSNKSTIFNEEYDEIDFNVFDFDFSPKACLFDFGGFSVSSSTPPGQQLLELKKRINTGQREGVLEIMNRAILNMVD